MIRILYEDNHLLGVEKPVNMPVCEDRSRDSDLLNACREYIRDKYQKPGNVYLGLVHRLDRPVGGAMVFAKTSKAASRLSDLIRKNELHKTYLAVLDGIPEKQSDILVDYLVKDHESNMVRVTDEAHGKRSELCYDVLAAKEGKTLVKIRLKTGRSHQIRVQFSSRKLPLMYDQRYHPNPGKGQIALWAYELKFIHPVKKEPVVIRSLPPDTDPWNLFKEAYDNCQYEK
jgi:23S rRNA pseudouridine1911/1915/1917 synthase